MSLKLSEMELEDFDSMINHAQIFNVGDDLVGPPTPICWPVSSQSKAQERLQFHMSKQRARFLGDRSAKYLKVIDENTNEIISIARWHKYPNGYSYEKGIEWEIHSPVEGKPFPKEMNIELHNFILSARDAERENWMGKGEACWILMHLVTRASHRNRGAAGMLINWGVEKARVDRIPAYLEAGAMARPIYEKHEFQQTGELMVLDLRAYGVGMDFVMAKMELKPREKKDPETAH